MFFNISKEAFALKRDDSCEGDLEVVKDVILQLSYND